MLLIILVTLVFIPVSAYPFISLDDPQYVTANPHVRAGLSFESLRWAFTTSQFYWHPLTWISHMIDVELFGLNSGAHHLVNVAIHAASTVVLFLAFNRLTGARGRSGIVAALFAVHPLHVESVAWIAERKDVLSTLFWATTLYAYTAFVRSRSVTRMLLVSVSFGAALMSKPMVVTLPVLLLLLDYWPLQRIEWQSGTGISRAGEAIREKIPLFVLATAAVVGVGLFQHQPRTIISLEALPLWPRLGNALVSYVLYLRDAVAPVRLSVFYPFASPSTVLVAGSTAILVTVTMLVVKFRRQAPYALVGWAWYLLTLTPVIGLVQAGDQGRADRFTYVPLIGIFMILAWGGFEIGRRLAISKLALAAAAGCVITAASVGASRQLRFWRDEVSLWQHAVNVTTRNYRAENHLGLALSNEGFRDEAIVHYLTAIEIFPRNAEAHNNLGAARIEEGNAADAVREFAAAAAIKPGMATFHYNLAVALDMNGETGKAIDEMSKAASLSPSNQHYAAALAMLTSRARH